MPPVSLEQSTIGVAPITHFRMRNKNIKIQGRSPNMVYHKDLLLKKEFAPSGSKFFPLREVPILKREANEENLC